MLYEGSEKGSCLLPPFRMDIGRVGDAGAEGEAIVVFLLPRFVALEDVVGVADDGDDDVVLYRRVEVEPAGAAVDR